LKKHVLSSFSIFCVLRSSKFITKPKSKKKKKLQPEAKPAFEPKAKNYNSNKQVEWVEKVGHGKDTDPVNEVEAPTRFPPLHLLLHHFPYL
jgi:hypothetical protein